MRSATQNKVISEAFFELLVFGFLLLILGIRGVQLNPASAAIEKRSEELSFFEKELQNQAVKITRSDLQDWISSVDQWAVFNHPEGGISVEYPATWIINSYQATDRTLYYLVPPHTIGYSSQGIQVVKYPNQKLQSLEGWFEEAPNYLGVIQGIPDKLPRELVVLRQGQQSLQVYSMPAASPEIHIFVAKGAFIFDVVITSPVINFQAYR